MVEVKILDHVKKSIKRHALAFRGDDIIEIYGWLLGYEEDNILNVVGSIPCRFYQNQSMISAEPKIEEVSELNKNIPKGIFICGIYHSHPNKVFHSSTDDETVLGFANLYTNFLSIVTNGIDIKYFQLKGHEVKEVPVKAMNSVKLFSSQYVTKIHTILPKKDNFTKAFIGSQLREQLNEASIDKIETGAFLRGKIERDDDFSLKKCDSKVADVYLDVDEGSYDTTTNILELELIANIVGTKVKTLGDIKSDLLQAFIDDMYHKLKHSSIKDGNIDIPFRLDLTIGGISWKFYIPLSDRDEIEAFFDLLAFKVEYMSIEKEKERVKLTETFLDMKHVVQKDFDKEHFKESLQKLSKRI